MSTALLLCASAANAQGAGTWMVRVGVTTITPHVVSGDLSEPIPPGAKTNILKRTELSGGIVRMMTDHLAIDIPLAMPFDHDVVGAGTIAGVGKIGMVRSLLATAFAKYRFLTPTSRLRPFLAAGPTVAALYNEKGSPTLTALTGGTPENPTTFDVRSKLTATVAAGASWSLSTRMYAEAAFTRTWLKSRATLSTGPVVDARLNPTSLTFSAGYRF